MEAQALVKRLTEQESFALHAGSRKLESLVPYIVGYVGFIPSRPFNEHHAKLTCRLWLDTFVMGIILMLFGLWFFRTRPTERRIFRALAVCRFPSVLVRGNKTAGTG